MNLKAASPVVAPAIEAPASLSRTAATGLDKSGWPVMGEALQARGLRAAVVARARGLNERRLAALAEARRHGLRMGGGDCGYSAVAINRELFKGQGTYVAAYNEALMAKTGDFAGHLVVRFDGKLWDADGTHAAEDVEAWGMLDPEDSDYAERYGAGWNEDLAYGSSLKEVDQAFILERFSDEYFLMAACSRMRSAAKSQGLMMPTLTFKEHPTTGYPGRTKENACLAHATIAIAVDFSTAGERLTKRVVTEARSTYCHAAFGDVSDATVAGIVEQLNQINRETLRLNIAGNGLSRFKGSNQAAVDAGVLELLRRVVEHPALKARVGGIRSGGQTGVDEAGIKAARNLGIDSEVLAPKGWLFRPADGKDVADEVAFKARFA